MLSDQAQYRGVCMRESNFFTTETRPKVDERRTQHLPDLRKKTMGGAHPVSPEAPRHSASNTLAKMASRSNRRTDGRLSYFYLREKFPAMSPHNPRPGSISRPLRQSSTSDQPPRSDGDHGHDRRIDALDGQEELARIFTCCHFSRKTSTSETLPGRCSSGSSTRR
jgi:hypothetical protein